MTTRELENRVERARTETFVIAQTQEGFRVHSPTSGGGPYYVDPASPSCTCKDFERHRSDSDWRCKHILAVRDRYGDPDAESYEREERAAIQAEANPATPETPHHVNGTAPQMLIKRSVSPDGRIDSLSVELSCPIEALVQDAPVRAQEILEVQGEIVQAFLDRENGMGQARREAASPTDRTPSRHRPPQEERHGAIEAQLLKIGGTDGKWGRRLFMTVQANGQGLRLYGSQKQLAEHLETAGYPDHAGNVREDVRLNLPCRIVTSESDDGFIRIEEVLPPVHRSTPRRRIH